MCFETIRMREVEKYMGRAEILIVDLRDTNEYIRGHIPGAYNISYEEEIDSFINQILVLMEQQQRKNGKKVTHILLYCDRGNISMLAARDLYKKGICVVNLYGGYLAYRGKKNIGYMP